MKKTLSLIVALVMVLTFVASFVAVADDFTAPDYEPANTTDQVGIMLANNVDYEGVVGIQTTGDFNGAWRDAVLFELDPTTGAYKALEFYGSAATGPAWTIGENQFVIETNCGNDWPTLFASAKGDEWYYSATSNQGIPLKDCPNFINAKQQAWDAVLKNIQIGSLYTLVGIDLANPVIIANYPVDETYAYITNNADYATYSYLTPYVEGSTETSEEVSEETPVVTGAENIALGKTYTLSETTPRGDGWDDNGTKLTDGVKVRDDTGSTDIDGFQGKNLEVVVDLGEVTAISGASADLLGNDSWGISSPSYDSVEFLYSTDGTNFTSIQKVEGTGLTPVYGTEGAWVAYEFAASATVEARYVKVIYTIPEDKGSHLWTSEIEVYAGEVAEESTETPAEESSEGTADTGDSGIIALAVISIIALAGAVVIKKK